MEGDMAHERIFKKSTTALIILLLLGCPLQLPDSDIPPSLPDLIPTPIPTVIPTVIPTESPTPIPTSTPTPIPIQEQITGTCQPQSILQALREWLFSLGYENDTDYGLCVATYTGELYEADVLFVHVPVTILIKPSREKYLFFRGVGDRILIVYDIENLTQYTDKLQEMIAEAHADL